MTNTLDQALTQAIAAQSAGGHDAVIAWYIITTGIGALVMHLYHTIVAAGGVKTIWRKFWSGDQSKNQS